jgi:hypothetical protein
MMRKSPNAKNTCTAFRQKRKSELLLPGLTHQGRQRRTGISMIFDGEEIPVLY